MFRKFFTLFTVFTMWFNAGIIPTYLNFKNFGLLDTRTAIIFGFAINTYNMIPAGAPFGGYKQSGNGRDKSLHALEKFTELKTIWIALES